jgi:rhodanese-related sulfurtransferase
MDPTEADARRDEMLLLDVREQQEWDAGHVTGSVHIPMNELPDRVAEIRGDRPVVAICRSGARSGRVTAWLDSQGQETHNLEGGLKAWHAAGLPLESADGGPGIVA